MLLGRDAKQRVPFWIGDGSVVEDQRRAAGERGDRPIPHHPSRRGVKKETIARREVAVQAMLLEMLEERTAVPMNDALRHSGGARREKHEERVIEMKPLERRGGIRREPLPLAFELAERRLGQAEILGDART